MMHLDDVHTWCTAHALAKRINRHVFEEQVTATDKSACAGCARAAPVAS